MSSHAVVIGGSIAGLCAARALRVRFARITVLEQDTIPAAPAARRGTPQALHNHILLGAGRDALEALFPGYTDRLKANGGNVFDPSYQAAKCIVDGWTARSRSGQTALFASRPLIESTIREFVATDPAITIVEQTRVEQLRSRVDGQGRPTITGVEYRDSHGADAVIDADFVVDATGRSSRARVWMASLGLDVEEMTLDAKVSYATRWYRWPQGEDRPWFHWMTVLPDPDPGAPPEFQYLCSINPVEDDSFIAVLGSWGLALPTDVEAFEAAAHKTRTREFARVLDASEPVTGVLSIRSTRNVWRRFDRMTAPPNRFVVVGDAVCSFNPVYTQGMSCAGLSATTLRRLLGTTDPAAPDFPARFYSEQAEFLRSAWLLALSRDCAFAHAVGTEALPDGWRRKLLRRTLWPLFQFITVAGWQDPVVGAWFDSVENLRTSVFDLIKNPRVLAGLAVCGVKQALGLTKVPPRTDPMLPPPSDDSTAHLRNLR